MKHLTALVALLLLGGAASSQLAPDQFVVTSSETDEILRYDANTGEFIDVFVPAGSGGMLRPLGMVFGPDGDLYVANMAGRNVLRFDGVTGAFLGVVISFPSFGMSRPFSLDFGPDGFLYIGGGSTALTGPASSMAGVALIKIDPLGGAPGSIIYWNPNQFAYLQEVDFGPDGLLYVSSWSDGVLRIDPDGGGLIDGFVPVQLPWPTEPNALMSAEFGPDGDLYTHLSGGRKVKRYDGSTGDFLDIFIGNQNPMSSSVVYSSGLEFDGNGDLFVAIQSGPNADRIGHYDGVTGDLIRILDPENLGGLAGPSSIAFVPRVGTTYGCANPPKSLTALSGLPRIGSTFTVGIDDPSGAATVGSQALVLVSRQRLGDWPCGISLAGFGLGGGAGELLVDVQPANLLEMRVAGTTWPGPGSPVPIDLSVPPMSILVGRDVFVQGALFDLAGSTGNRFGLTDGLVVRFTP